MKLDTLTDAELDALLAYERDVESRRKSADRVARSLRKIERLEAERVRRVLVAARVTRAFVRTATGT